MSAINDAQVVALSGDIDLDTAPATRQALAQAIASGRPGPVIADMSAVAFIDSTGVSALVIPVTRRAVRGGSFVYATSPRGRCGSSRCSH